MATRENSISDSSQVDLDIFCPDVDQHDLETTNSRINHHLQIVLSGERRLNGEALTSFNVLTGRNENLPGGSDPGELARTDPTALARAMFAMSVSRRLISAGLPAPSQITTSNLDRSSR